MGIVRYVVFDLSKFRQFHGLSKPILHQPIKFDEIRQNNGLINFPGPFFL